MKHWHLSVSLLVANDLHFHSETPMHEAVSDIDTRGADKSLAWPTSQCILFDG